MASDTFAANLKQLHKLWSTWAVFLVSTAAAYWMQLDLGTQQAIIAEFPQIKLLGPLFGFVSFAVARAVPQGAPPQE